jgi:hypothetical protein
MSPRPIHKNIDEFHEMDGRGSNPDRGKIHPFSTASRPALGPTRPPIQRVPGQISPGVKRPKREADHSLPYSGDVKNGGATPLLPHTTYGVLLN